MHYDSELDVLEEYIARMDSSILVRQSAGGVSPDVTASVFESQLDRTSAAMCDSVSQVLLHATTQV